MARLFPNTPAGTIAPEALKLYRLLKALPDDYNVWLRLPIWPAPGPDFCVLREDGRGLLLKVSPATTGDVQAVRQSALFDTGQNAEPIGQREQAALCQFVEQVAWSSSPAPERTAALPGVIVFPNLSDQDLAPALPPDVPGWITWTGKEALTASRLGDWLDARLGSPLDGDAIEALRKAFTPEAVVPSGFTVRQSIERNVTAQLTDYLLDYDQEWAVKLDLALSDEAEAATDAFGLRLINGVAGSGKSLVIVYRAHLLSQLYPGKRILVLTHNRPLIHDLQARYHVLSHDGQSVEWKTFIKWCQTQWPSNVLWQTPLGQRRRREIVTLAWRERLDGTSISERMLQDEIDWFKDRLLVTLEDYLAADRSGRKFALNESLRRRVFEAMLAYQRELSRRKALDWGDVPRKVWRFMNEGRIQLPPYDVILIDEAQFFAPLWFEIVKRMLKPVTGHLFLVADPTQGFLKRGQSWLSSGLDVRGKSLRLSKSYRTTRQILNFATTFYRSRLGDAQDEDIIAPDLSDMPPGVCPEIISLTSGQDEVTRAVNEIKRVIARGARLEHILVLHADWQGAQRMLYRLCKELGAEAAADPKETPRGSHIRVCTLNAATGLESPIVFVMGVHALFEEEQSVRLAEQEQAELVRDNTRKLYMAFTRAGQRLVITCSGEAPAELAHALAACQQMARESVRGEPGRTP